MGANNVCIFSEPGLPVGNAGLVHFELHPWKTKYILISQPPPEHNTENPWTGCFFFLAEDHQGGTVALGSFYKVPSP